MNQLAQIAILMQYISFTSGSVLCSTTNYQTVYPLINLIAIECCRARQYSYAIRHGCFPCEVVALFNGAQPSTGHAKRICRILRSESWKQVGRYRDVLRIKCHALSVNESSAERNYKLHLRTAAQYTEVFWQQTRMTLAKKARRNEGGQQEVTVLEDVILPKQIKDCLDKGPKYCQEPCMNPVLKLSLIRWMGDKAKPEDRERCVADGVDVLQRLEGKTTRKFKTNTIVDYFLEHHLKLLTSDKEGGFVVLPEALYKTKAKEAIQKNFKPVRPGPLAKDEQENGTDLGDGKPDA
ncbi:hypothetical protein HPB47_019667 [Ixodes persulcatus]|uniref:Uncharacterized protein n=1 Tax=Ixodes persulcatus TaxID=34615 RepID=A0AC60QL25_IXOPE|nr:hypothetical protein HPB47_019667 [Ixodes persulcatus]